MGLRTSHAAESVSQARTDSEKCEHLEEIGERCRILERVGAVGVEEATAISAEFLDDFLRSDWALGDGLRRNCIRDWLAIRPDHRFTARVHLLNLLRLKQLDRVVRLEVLNYSL